MVLRIQVLGRMVVECDGIQMPSPKARRAWSLLANLALASGPQARSELAARFWPDVLDSSARASLRSAIWSLRQALGPAESYLVVDRDHVGLAVGPEVWVDAIAFESLVLAGSEQEAVALCRGELLEGFEEEWALSARDAHRERLLDVLERLAAGCQAAGERNGAIEWTRRQVAVDPLGEESHRRLIGRLAASGNRATALVVYRTFAERLRRELAVAPSPPTRELAESLRKEPEEHPAGGATAPEDADDVGLLDRARPVGVARSFTAMFTNALPLVGRSPELDRLVKIWGSVASGHGGVVTLSGEAGIGKTRLASELLARAAGEGALTASCAALDLGGAAPFGLWAELIRGLLETVPHPPADVAWPDDLARLAPEIQARFQRVVSERPFVSPDLERARLLEAAVALIEWAARDRPLALLIEDTHIADASSLELTGYVARRIATLPVLFILTRRQLPRRPEADQLEHALRLRGLLRAELTLDPLEPASAAELARSAAALTEQDVAQVVKLAEGNALLTVETARAISRGEREPSAGIRGAVRGAFASLTAAGQSFVELTAVAARELEHSEVTALPIERPTDAAVQALDSGLLVTRERRIGFRHALLRDAVYADLPEPRRAELHESWARTLLACEQAGGARRSAEVARHLRFAGLDREAVRQLSLAAADARAVGALAEAAGYLREALSMAADRADLLLELAEIEAWRTRRTAAEDAFAAARALLDGAPPLQLARAWLRSARAYHGPICVPLLVNQSCHKALELLDEAHVEALWERREALASLAWTEAIAGSVEEAEKLLEQVHDLAAGAQADDLSIYHVGHARALTMMRREDFVASYAPAIAAGEAITRAGRPDLAYGCWANAAGAAAAAGDHQRALQFLDRGVAALRGKGLVSLEIQLLAMRSFVLLRIGEPAQARAAADAESALADRLGDPGLLAMAAHDRGLVALAEEDFELACTLLEQALVEGAPISRPLTRLAWAEALARAGQPREAEAELRATVLEPVRSSDFPAALVPRLARVQGSIAAAAGDRALAVRRLREAAEGWRRQVSTLTRGESMAVVLADLGRPVVGLVEPERELERVLGELQTIQATTGGASAHAVVS